MMQHFVIGSRFAEVRAHGMRENAVPVRSFPTHHNYHYGQSQRTSTSVPLGIRAGTPLAPRIPRIITWEQVVEAPLRGAEPLDTDVNRPPSFLEVAFLPGLDRLPFIERAAIPEVQACPPHSCILSGGAL